MTSRTFFKNIIAALALTALVALPFRIAAADDGRQYYELRIYSTDSDAQRQQVTGYWQNAAVPAYNRLGIQPIGVFTELQESATNRIYVLIPFESLDALAAIPGKLAVDSAYQKAAADYLDLLKPKAAYSRFESSIHAAFDGMKRLSVSSDKKAEVFELRTYMSPSEGKGNNKVQMFNSGEITVMKEVGLAPVFYGQTIAGSHMPSLVYMTSGESLEEHRKHWQAFSAAPIWKKLQSDPQYKDNMIGMIQVLLKRVPGSQI